MVAFSADLNAVHAKSCCCKASVILQVSKTLACGDVGNGAMASPDAIAEAAISAASRCLAKHCCKT